MKNIKTLALSAILVSASASNAAVVLDFTGVGNAVSSTQLSVTDANGATINYTVDVLAGTFIGNANRFDANNEFEVVITFTNGPVDFTVARVTPVTGIFGNSGDNEGVRFDTDTTFTGALTQATANLAGDGTSSVLFTRPNGAGSSSSELDFGSFTSLGANSITVSAEGGLTNREAFTFTVEAAPVPEPSSTVLLGLGAFAFSARRRR